MKIRGIIFTSVFALACGDAMTGSPGPLMGTPTEWTCLGEKSSMAQRQMARVQYVVPVVDSDSEASFPVAVSDLSVRVCADSVCASELAQCSDGDGGYCFDLHADAEQPYIVTVDFPFGYDGGLRFSAPGYTDMDYDLGGPMVGMPDGEMRVVGNAVYMPSTQAFARFYTSLGETADPTRGVLMATVLDCAGQRAAGAQLRPLSGNDDGSVAYRLSVNNTATPDTLETDYRGVAGLANLLPDAFEVGAMAQSGGEYARATVVVRPNAMSLAEIRAGLGVWGQ